ncbi:spindle and kinetochore-associated protein 1 isoform X2 [Phycodurus eques]|uniref:spindle and kinetochore-associated protein 1 isoform X2 n=1 Tax=Phycodurus eques TaxID=693459 RepID=UPI002ACE4E3D|nr:spindle and kinetochore-associated protein 1 isoform X2 [Phycodurus eques]XP_061533291.1 spindle and kinetochore-associated protein 1 isoform X2 [Phycodurus eques]XP_061533292.1 spindle and kinetochore-associated protein 1 isoform X2 [Phycodurus eques]
MGDLETISCHINDRISSIQCLLDLSIAEVPQNKMKKLKQELDALEKLLMEFEKNVGQQKDQLQHLKAVEELFQNNRESLQHLKDNVPAHMPNLCPNKENEPITHKSQVPDVESTQQQTVKIKSHVRQIEFITLTEFECIPRYMKGRLSYDQLNKAVENINTAVVAKYKIFHQPLKTLNNHARKLYQRFKDQETKDTKGEYFVVEDDFREFTQMKVDKRLQGILNMLRHCQRLRELRGGGITRYMFL